MKDSDVKKLKRAELLEMLIEQGEENDRLKMKVAELELRLSERQIKIDNAGSIAEAALSLTNIFAEAQDAAERYLVSVRQQNEELESRIAARVQETEERCAGIERQIRTRCEKLIRDTKAQCEAMKREAASGVTEDYSSPEFTPQDGFDGSDRNPSPEDQPRRRRHFGRQ